MLIASNFVVETVCIVVGFILVLALIRVVANRRNRETEKTESPPDAEKP
jgi:hypothetical protein